jgi:hypothetical protein
VATEIGKDCLRAESLRQVEQFFGGIACSNFSAALKSRRQFRHEVVISAKDEHYGRRHRSVPRKTVGGRA